MKSVFIPMGFHGLFSILFVNRITNVNAALWQCSPGAYDLYELYPELVDETENTNNSSVGEGSSGYVRVVGNNVSLRAIKYFFPETSPGQVTVHEREIYYEYWLGKTLSHTNIAKSRELQHDDGVWSMTMDYIPFPLLRLLDYQAYVIGEPWSFRSISCLFHQLLDAVAYMHSLGVAHRDIKVENLMISRDGALKLIDLGSAGRFRDDLTGHKYLSWENKVGTPVTMPPEVEGEGFFELEPADVWALGTVFLRLWLGAYPWQQASLEDNAFAGFVEAIQEAKGCAGLDEQVTGVQGTLLCSLPGISREMIKGMLELDPMKRVTADGIFKSSWMRAAAVEMGRG